MKPALICFVEGIEAEPHFQHFIQECEQAGYESYVFTDTVTNRVRPEDTLLLLEHVLSDSLENVEMTFVSNIRDFFRLTYRIYHRTYDRFVYYQDNNAEHPIMFDEPIYQTLIDSEIQPEEQLYKPAYTYDAGNTDYSSIERGPWLATPNATDKKEIQHNHRNIYVYGGSHYVFEPSGFANPSLISLTPSTEQQQPARIDYRYPYEFPNQVKSALLAISGAPQHFTSRYADYQELFHLYADQLKSQPYFARQFAMRILEDTTRFEPEHYRIFVLSFLVRVLPHAHYLNKILKLALNGEQLTPNQKFFLFYQCVRQCFVDTKLPDGDTSYLFRKIYQQIYILYREELGLEGAFIPKEDRDQDFVFVMTGQLLSLNHAPTKTALDRCYALVKSMNKRVLLINTKELLSSKEIVPFYDITLGNVIKDFEKLDKIDYKNVSIPFYQPTVAMPDRNEIQNITQMVRKYKPYFILSIGSANLTADLCSNIVPTIDISAPYFSLPVTHCQFPVIGRKATESDRKVLKDFNVNPDNLIESVFTFDFKAQENTYTRERFKLPADKKLLLLVGYRLDLEVSEEFLRTLLETINSGTHLVFLGGFDMGKWLKSLPELKKHATNLGFQSDVLAILDLCDIYVNPKRAGGGTSVVEAMYKGIPAVTLPFGDVSTSVPDEFRVGSLEEMRDRIIRYVTEPDFYEAMSNLAKETSVVLMNTQEELKRIVQFAESSPDF